MSDIRDPYEAERLDVVAPDELHTRRDFLQRTAVTAGLAASLGLTLHPDTVIAAAARQLIYGLLLIAFMLFRPQGLAGERL